MDGSCHLRAPAGLRQNKSVPVPIKNNRWSPSMSWDCVKGKIPYLTSVPAKINIRNISINFRHQRATGLAEWLKAFIQGLKLWKKKWNKTIFFPDINLF
jgi:hypothetical protein